jgi:DNA-binding HxlR family transcriptional regulator
MSSPDAEKDNEFNRTRAELFEAIGHQTRIRILEAISQEPLTFSGLKKRVSIESSGHLSFHLEKLSNLIRSTPEGTYALTDDGREALRLIRTVHETEPMQVARPGGSRLISLLPLLLIAPIGLISVVSLILQVQLFFNPCITWGMASGGSISVSSGSPCSMLSGGMSETIPQAVLQLALIQGGILFALGLGVVGFFRAHPRLVIVGSLILILESIPFVVDGLFVFTLLAAAALLLSMRTLTRLKSPVPY